MMRDKHHGYQLRPMRRSWPFVEKSRPHRISSNQSLAPLCDACNGRTSPNAAGTSDPRLHKVLETT